MLWDLCGQHARYFFPRVLDQFLLFSVVLQVWTETSQCRYHSCNPPQSDNHKDDAGEKDQGRDYILSAGFKFRGDTCIYSSFIRIQLQGSGINNALCNDVFKSNPSSGKNLVENALS